MINRTEEVVLRKADFSDLLVGTSSANAVMLDKKFTLAFKDAALRLKVEELAALVRYSMKPPSA